METVFDALKAMGKATSIELAARLDISREEVLNELWELKRLVLLIKARTPGVWLITMFSRNSQRRQNCRKKSPQQQ